MLAIYVARGTNILRLHVLHDDAQVYTCPEAVFTYFIRLDTYGIRYSGADWNAQHGIAAALPT